MNNRQLRELIIKPVLLDLDMYSQEAEDLIAGTIAQESRMGHFIKQHPTGPALGICQMEPATHDDLWENWLKYRQDISNDVFNIAHTAHAEDMIHNLKYAVAMCRIHYYRKPGAIPKDVHGQAAYWKLHYNTPEGKGTEADYMLNYGRYAIRRD